MTGTKHPPMHTPTFCRICEPLCGMIATVEDGKLVAVPRKRPKYTLDELLAQCDPDAPITEEERMWMDLPPVGREII